MRVLARCLQLGRGRLDRRGRRRAPRRRARGQGAGARSGAPLPQATQLQPRIVNGTSAVAEHPAVGAAPFVRGGPCLLRHPDRVQHVPHRGRLLPHPHAGSGRLLRLPSACGLFSVQTINLDPTWTGPSLAPATPRCSSSSSRPPASRRSRSTPSGGLRSEPRRPSSASEPPRVGLPAPASESSARDRSRPRPAHRLASDDTDLCWTLQAPLGPAGQDSGICFGDSGGPLLIDASPGTVVAGIHSKFTFVQQLPRRHPSRRHRRVPAAGVDPVGRRRRPRARTSCGTIAQVSDPGSATTGVDSFLDRTTFEELWTVDVPAGAASFRAAVNLQGRSMRTSISTCGAARRRRSVRSRPTASASPRATRRSTARSTNPRPAPTTSWSAGSRATPPIS